MAYTALQLITNAWYLSGIVSRGLETVSGEQMSDGLFLLNSVLNIKQADTRLIPYYKRYDFSAVTGQEKYFIPNLLWIETFTFYIGSLRYGTNKQTRKRFWGSGRVENIQSLPFEWEAERTLGGTDLYIYFLPNQNFPLTIFGKFGLDDVTLNEDLSTAYDLFYLEYLRYALAEYMCSDYGITFQPQSYKKLQEYEHTLMDISPMDLTINKCSALQDVNPINYAYVNLSGGWWPP